jgi:carbon storage regulator CsrA
MLVITRNVGEAIIIDNCIKIMYLGKGHYDECKIGIYAPSEMIIHREEIQKRINRINAAAQKEITILNILQSV